VASRSRPADQAADLPQATRWRSPAHADQPPRRPPRSRVGEQQKREIIASADKEVTINAATRTSRPRSPAPGDAQRTRIFAQSFGRTRIRGLLPLDAGLSGRAGPRRHHQVRRRRATSSRLRARSSRSSHAEIRTAGAPLHLRSSRPCTKAIRATPCARRRGDHRQDRGGPVAFLHAQLYPTGPSPCPRNDRPGGSGDGALGQGDRFLARPHPPRLNRLAIVPSGSDGPGRIELGVQEGTGPPRSWRGLRVSGRRCRANSLRAGPRRTKPCSALRPCEFGMATSPRDRARST